MSEAETVFGCRWLFKRFGHWLAPYRGAALLIVAALCVDLAYENLLPLAFKALIDDAIGPHNAAVLWTVIGGLVALCLTAAAAATARDYLYAKLSAQVLHDLRLAMYGQLQRLSMSFYSRTQVGDIMSRFSSDLTVVENAIVLALPSGVYSALGVVATALILFALEWRLALLSAIGIPLCLIGPKLIGARAQSAANEMREQQGALASLIQENVSAQAVVKSFGLQRIALDAFAQRVAALLTISRRANFLAYLMERTPNLGLMVFNLSVICLGAWLAFEGHLAIGSLVAFQGLFLNLSQSVAGLTWVVPNFIQAAAGMARIEELLGEHAEIVDAPGAEPLPRLSAAIEFRDVSFCYAGQSGGLDHVSFRIEAGQKVAFVGASGSGKSTVLALLLRFYDPQAGGVFIDGRDLRAAQQATLRAQSAVVMQESFLFNTSVRENLLLARPQAGADEIVAACRAAEIHDAILSLPEGYDTVVGERGGRLSGGQRQRIAIARALLRDPALLVLDEATSALDAATESAVNATLARVAGGRTVVSVTHRLAAATGADRIFVMDGGRLIESGSHDELVALRGVYAGMWAKQSGFRLSAEGDWAGIDAARLAAMPVLEALDAPLLEEVARAFVTEQYAADRMVMQQGDPGDRFYIVVRGSVEVLRTDENGTRRVAVLRDGDHFGEIALLRDLPRNAGVRTLSPCLLISLPRGHFLKLVGRSAEMQARLARALAERS